MDDLNELPDNLKRALKALDDRSAESAAKLDSARVAEAVVRRLRDPAVSEPRPFWQMRNVRIAAALAFLAATGVVIERATVRLKPVETAQLPVAEHLDSLDATQLSDLLDVVDDSSAAATVSAPASVTVDDLNEQELQALLNRMESEGGS